MIVIDCCMFFFVQGYIVIFEKTTYCENYHENHVLCFMHMHLKVGFCTPILFGGINVCPCLSACSL